jgi:hypothetical protein
MLSATSLRCLASSVASMFFILTSMDKGTSMMPVSQRSPDWMSSCLRFPDCAIASRA